MVLINIDTLSDAELRCIAQQENVEDWDVLSREDLIDSIEEIYEDENGLEPTHPAYTGHRYVKTLTNVENQGSFELPGVEELPNAYSETSIHLIAKDANWAYAFWSLSPQVQETLSDSNSKLVIRAVVTGKNNVPEASFDIDVLGSDMDWSFELPWTGKEYKAVLVKKNNETEEILAESNSIFVNESWLSKHPNKLRNCKDFEVLVTSLVTKGGKLVNNRQVREIVARATSYQEDMFEEE